MPARMWRHGIHSFLELLRHRLPASREHMITFIYMAYSIIALLYETVPAFEDTWIECLGDLSRYRMAIEDDNVRTRDTWTAVSRRWYSLASDRAPTTGRLYHHLAILARPHVINQMYYYVKSLCVPIPFTSTRDSILTLLDPCLNNTTQHVPAIELAFIKAHAIMFKNNLEPTPDFEPAVKFLIDNLDTHIAISSPTAGDDDDNDKATEQVLATSLEDIVMTDGVEQLKKADADADAATAEPAILKALEHVQELVTKIDRVVFSRIGDANCHGYIHARLVWMLCMPQVDKTAEEEKRIREIQLRQLTQQRAGDGGYNLYVPTEPPLEDIPPPPPVRSDEVKPLPDDWFLRGLLWTDNYFPQGWFANMESFNEDERMMETPSTRLVRKERLLWVACRLASYKTWITYNSMTHQFKVTDAFRRADKEQKSLNDVDPIGAIIDATGPLNAHSASAPGYEQLNFRPGEVKMSIPEYKMEDIEGSPRSLQYADSSTADFDTEDDERKTTTGVRFDDEEGVV
ncbi:MAG: hypothetical protein STHCBS139747_002590 [Sporothrix thermara]